MNWRCPIEHRSVNRLTLPRSMLAFQLLKFSQQGCLPLIISLVSLYQCYAQP